MKNEQLRTDLAETINAYLQGKRSIQFLLSFISELPEDSLVSEEVGQLGCVDYFQEKKLREVFIRMLKKLEKVQEQAPREKSL